MYVSDFLDTTGKRFTFSHCFVGILCRFFFACSLIAVAYSLQVVLQIIVLSASKVHSGKLRNRGENNY